MNLPPKEGHVQQSVPSLFSFLSPTPETSEDAGTRKGGENDPRKPNQRTGKETAMKLTIKQVKATMAAAWGRQAFVIPYHLAGNRYSYAVTDHKEHWRPLLASWAGGHQVFEVAGSTWPEPIRTPEPSPMT